ncbi:hypothetical protein GCM10009827_003550 [Dactylosporangium maewongense]|uniref:Uncharacterized protein n=1 Tax=Dactylosporangium maewongense TaxID=634393 RepID=A0ABN1ZIQ4_9ACTN
MGFGDADDDVGAAVPAAVRLLQHPERLPDAGCGAEVHPQQPTRHGHRLHEAKPRFSCLPAFRSRRTDPFRGCRRGELFGLAVLTVTEAGITAITLFDDPAPADRFSSP